MKREIMMACLAIIFGYQSCNTPKQESASLSDDKEEAYIYPTPPACYGINEGRPFDKPLDLERKIFGRVAVRVEIDTLNLKLKNVRVIKTFLKKYADSLAYAAFQNTDFYKEPKYPEDVKELLPQIKQYLDTVKVTKSPYVKECEMPSSYSILIKIE